MSGMNRSTGATLSGLDHLQQSIADILTTPLGSRLARREYGSLLPELLDHPDSGSTRVRLYSAVAGALMRWEPRLRLSRVQIVSGAQPGQTVVELQGQVVSLSGAGPVSLSMALQMRAAT